MEEFLQRGNALFRLLALALPGGIDAPDVPGEAGKARRGALADILEIRRVYDSENPRPCATSKSAESGCSMQWLSQSVFFPLLSMPQSAKLLVHIRFARAS